jgi:hypothetical protein
MWHVVHAPLAVSSPKPPQLPSLIVRNCTQTRAASAVFMSVPSACRTAADLVGVGLKTLGYTIIGDLVTYQHLDVS